MVSSLSFYQHVASFLCCSINLLFSTTPLLLARMKNSLLGTNTILAREIVTQLMNIVCTSIDDWKQAASDWLSARYLVHIHW